MCNFNVALVKVAKLYRAAQSDLLGALGLHPGQDVLLWTLAGRPDGMLVSEIAVTLGVEQPTVTRSLSRLEQGGWFVREPVPGDRRATLVKLTDKGNAVIPSVEATWRTLAETATAGLSPADRVKLVGLLEHVRENLGSLATDA